MQVVFGGRMIKVRRGAENGYHYCDAYRVWVCVSPEATAVSGLSWLKAFFLEYDKLSMPAFHVCLQSPYLKLVLKHENTNPKSASEIREHEDVHPKTNLLPSVFFNWKIAKIEIPRCIGGVL